MTDQTNLEDKIREILDGEGSDADKIQAIYDDLLSGPLLPDPLFGAWATHPECGEGIVVSPCPDKDGEVQFIFQFDGTSNGTSYLWVNPSELTFHTSETPDHPEFLETEEDYRNAPEGTIVASNDERKALLIDELWRQAGLSVFGHDAMAGTRRRVLRWKWEE